MVCKCRIKISSFTLVELVIVIAIIAILGVASFLIVTKWVAVSRDSRRLNDIGTIKRSIEIYQTEGNKAPEPGGIIGVGMLEKLSGWEKFSIVGDFTESSQESIDSLVRLPKDPFGYYYVYGVDIPRREFEVAATLERGIFANIYTDQAYSLSEMAKVYGNYKPRKEILTGHILKVIPTLLFIRYGENDINLGKWGDVDFIVDEGYNVQYTESGEPKVGDDNNVSLGRVIGNKDANFDGIDILGLSGADTKEILDKIYNISGNPQDMRDLVEYIKEEGYEINDEDIEEYLEDYEFIEPTEEGTPINKDGGEIHGNTINETTCRNVGWYWIDGSLDLQGDGFCISPRIEVYGEEPLYNKIGISWNDAGTDHGWTSISGELNGNYASDERGITTYLSDYECKKLGSQGVSDYIGEDNVLGRMKWISSFSGTGDYRDELSNIDWIDFVNWTNTGKVIPAIYIADCIDGQRNIGPGTVYNGITWNDYLISNTDTNVHSTVERNEMNNYLMGWTNMPGSHLPSAFSDISDSSRAVIPSGGHRGEYQIACNALKTNTNTDFYYDGNENADDGLREWIRTSAVGDPWSGRFRGRKPRQIGYDTNGHNGCNEQMASDGGSVGSSMAARFVVRPYSSEYANLSQCTCSVPSGGTVLKETFTHDFDPNCYGGGIRNGSCNESVDLSLYEKPGYTISHIKVSDFGIANYGDDEDKVDPNTDNICQIRSSLYGDINLGDGCTKYEILEGTGKKIYGSIEYVGNNLVLNSYTSGWGDCGNDTCTGCMDDIEFEITYIQN